MIQELKPCPFCGRRARLVHSDGMYWCECTNGNCEAVQPVCNHVDVAIKTWNRRAGHWQPLRHDDPYFDDSPVWLDENGCVCWWGANGEKCRLILHGDMRLCLFVEGEGPSEP